MFSFGWRRKTERSVSTAAGVDHELGEAVRWVEGYAVRQLSDRLADHQTTLLVVSVELRLFMR